MSFWTEISKGSSTPPLLHQSIIYQMTGKRSLEEIPFHLSNAQEQSKKYADFPDYLLVQTAALPVTHNRMIGDGQMCDTQIKQSTHCFRLSSNKETSFYLSICIEFQEK